ncbi:hypothetical protein [Saccharopolyspora hattusasensis]|uniref:hypothetical protein n=1 Tax=Saccharopolyspora hattusasensis TaxID=1128679 RepID=UPI003D972FB7
MQHGVLFGYLIAGSDRWARDNEGHAIDRCWAAGHFSPYEVDKLHVEHTDILAQRRQH